MNIFQCRERQVSMALVWFSMFVVFIQNVTSKHSFLCIFTVSKILASGIGTATEETVKNMSLQKYSLWNLCHILTPVRIIFT
jgi:hypothetical protein